MTTNENGPSFLNEQQFTATGSPSCVIVPFVNRSKPGSSKRKVSDNERPLVDSYLTMLCSRKLLCSHELRVLQAALQPLKELMPVVQAGIIERVRGEMAAPRQNKYTVRRDELKRWTWRRGNRCRTLIPGFDFARAYQHFLVTIDEDPDGTIRFLRPTDHKPLGRYVPPSLRMAEVFFFVVLRMYRYQHEKDCRAGQRRPGALLRTIGRLAARLAEGCALLLGRRSRVRALDLRTTRG